MKWISADMNRRKTAYNTTYRKGGVSCSKDSFVVNESLGFQMKFCDEHNSNKLRLNMEICV